MITFSILCILAMLFNIPCSSAIDTIKESPLKDILNPKTSNYIHRMIFLTRSMCRFKTPPLAEINNLELNTEDFPRTRKECSDTIGFLPLTKDKVELFVMADWRIPSGKTAVKSIEIKLKSTTADVTVLTCNPSGETAEVTPGTSTDFSVEVSKDKGTLLLHDAVNPIVQCPGVLLKKKGVKDIYELIEKGEWSMTVKSCCKADAATKESCSPTDTECSSGETYTGKLSKEDNKGIDMILKKFCEFDRLHVPNKNEDMHKTYKPLTKEKSSADDIEKSDHSLFSGESKVTNALCTDEHSMIYTITTEGKSETSSGIADAVDCAFTENKYQYAIRTSENKDVVVSDIQNIELECSQYKCRKCKKPSPETCPGDVSDCKGFDVHMNKYAAAKDYNKCYEVDTSTCKSGIILLNGKIQKILKNDANSISCNENSNFKINNQIIANVSCLKTFSAMETPLSFAPPPGLVKEGVSTKLPVNCFKPITGCQCVTKDMRNLAFANKNGTDWLRIESLIFNFQDGVYEYNRTNETGTTNLHTFNPERAVQCISDVPLPRKEDAPKNPLVSMVIGANIGAIVALAAIAVPGVILFVNARIKKREAHKAAKKNKKKEDGSGEKKDVENKDVNENEKKNQA